MAKKNFISEEYKDRIFDGDNYLSQRRKDAINSALTRTESYRKPAWWDDEKRGHFLDCISTALSNYGEPSVVTGNQSFESNPDNYGFRVLSEGEKPEPGDIIQYYNDLNIPSHAVMFTKGEYGKGHRVAYSPGYGNYDFGDPYLQDASDWWSTQKDYTPRFYRFIGTPAERQAIAEHNAAIRANNLKVYGNENGPQQIRPEIQKPEPVKASDVKKKLNIFDLAEMAK